MKPSQIYIRSYSDPSMVNFPKQAVQSGISLVTSLSVNRCVTVNLTIATSFAHLPSHDGWSEFHLDGFYTTLLTLIREKYFYIVIAHIFFKNVKYPCVTDNL